MDDSGKKIRRQEKNISMSGIFGEGYGIVPKLLMKADDLSITTKAVLCYLLSYAGAGAESWPSHTEIIHNLKISKRTLARSINQAIDGGYVTQKRKFSRSIGSRNIYNLTFMSENRGATRAPSKIKRVPWCHLEGPPEHPPIKSNSKINTINMGQQQQRHFTAPTEQQVAEYLQELKTTTIDPAYFIDYYTSKDWMIGKNKMKDWKAAIRNWERRGVNFEAKSKPKYRESETVYLGSSE